MKKILLYSARINQNTNSGFTLIELLVVIIIVGILSAASLGGVFGLIRKARKAEAISYIDACQKKQFSYYLENTQFTQSLELLGLPKEGNYYTYNVEIHNPEEVANGLILVCCTADEKGGNGEMVFGCVSPGS